MEEKPEMPAPAEQAAPAPAAEQAAPAPEQRNASLIRVCVDADGGDDAPAVVADGVRLALQADSDLHVVLVGREASVSQVAGEFPDRITPVVTTEVIEMGDHPADAVRHKKDSSIVVGCKLVHQGEADCFFSAGSTGAVLTAATILIGRVKGVQRPALATIVPVPGHPTVLLDCGANADCKPEHLVQFAHMGRAYAQSVLGMADPTVGLLNNGAEETKGCELAIEAHAMMRDQIPGFAGNVEGGGLMSGACDIVVADGFTGNVALKIIEGTAKMLFKSLKGAMTSSLGNKLAAAKLSGAFHQIKDSIDPDTYGGAPLLGARAACIIGHGSSSAVAIKNGVLQCAAAARGGLPDKIATALADAKAASAASAATAGADAAAASANNQ